MLHACTARFDVTENLEKFWGFLRTEQGLALFRSKNFLDFDIVALLFLFDKYYPIKEQLDLKDLFRDLQVNCAISYLFYLYLMFHTCVVRFDGMENLVKFWVFKQDLSQEPCMSFLRRISCFRSSSASETQVSSLSRWLRAVLSFLSWAKSTCRHSLQSCWLRSRKTPSPSTSGIIT